MNHPWTRTRGVGKSNAPNETEPYDCCAGAVRSSGPTTGPPLAPHGWSCQPFATLMSTRINSLLVTAAAVAVSSALFAQSQPPSTNPEQQLRQQIVQLQSETGLVRPAELVDPLRTLATLYQQAGDHPLALATLEEARYVTRAHQGLSSGDEALLLRQQIVSERALGNHWRVWDLEQNMVTIARKNPDDIRMAQVFRE